MIVRLHWKRTYILQSKARMRWDLERWPHKVTGTWNIDWCMCCCVEENTEITGNNSWIINETEGKRTANMRVSAYREILSQLRRMEVNRKITGYFRELRQEDEITGYKHYLRLRSRKCLMNEIKTRTRYESMSCLLGNKQVFCSTNENHSTYNSV